MKLICKKTGKGCLVCMGSKMPECPNLIKVDDPPKPADEPDQPPAV